MVRFTLPQRSAFRVTFLYAVFGIVWVVDSDAAAAFAGPGRRCRAALGASRRWPG